MSGDEIQVGKEYMGSVITHVDVQTRDIGDKFHERTVFKLKNGTIMTQDFIDRIPDEHVGSYKKGPFDPVPFMKKIKTSSYKSKKILDFLDAKFDDDTTDTLTFDREPRSPRSPTKKKKKKKGKPKDKTAKKPVRQKSFSAPMDMTVFCLSDPELPPSSLDTPRAVWSQSLESMSELSDFIPRQKVQLYMPGHSLEDIDPDLPQGMWCYNEGTGPRDENDWKPYDAVLYAPGEELPEDVQADAFYTFHPDASSSARWPATPNSKSSKDTIAMKPTRQQSFSIPMEMPVYSSNHPNLPKASPSAPRALWQLSLDSIDDVPFQEQKVLLYRPGEVPDSLDPELPKGKWRYNDDTGPSGTTDDWQPYDAILYPPDYTMPDDLNVDGIYTFHPESTHKSWPPPPFLEDESQSSEVFEELRSPVSQDRKAKMPVRRSSISEMDMTAFSLDDPDLPHASPNHPRAVWSGGLDSTDDVFPTGPFQQQRIRLYKPGCRPRSTDPDISQGVWGYNAGTERAINAEGENAWKPFDAILFPPGSKLPSDVNPEAFYTFHPDAETKKWPPPPLGDKVPCAPIRSGKTDVKNSSSDNSSTKDHAPKIPRRFRSNDWDPLAGLAVSKKSSPSSCNPDDDDLTGVWEYLEEPEEDQDWMPMEVVVVREEDLDISKTSTYGVFAISNNARPSHDGRWDSRYFNFFPPGEEVSDNNEWTRLGYWQPARGENNSWPPNRQAREVPTCFEEDWVQMSATAYPSTSAPGFFVPEKTGRVRGVWATMDPAEMLCQEPIDLVLAPDNEMFDVDSDEPNGIFAISKKAHSLAGAWDPHDFLFFPPKREPEEDAYRKMGRWRPRRDESGRSASQTREMLQRASSDRRSVPRQRKPGQLPRWGSSKNWIANNAKVFIGDKVPLKQSEEDVTFARWKFNDHRKEPDDSNRWVPQEIVFYEPGHEPDTLEDDPKNYGVWGTNPALEPTAVNGHNCSPVDVWVYPPGEEPEPGFVPLGKWGYPPGLVNVSFPPIQEDPDSDISSLELSLSDLKKTVNSNKLGQSKGSMSKSSGSKDLPPRVPKRFQSHSWEPVSGIAFPKKEAPESFDPDDEITGVWEIQSEEENEKDLVPTEVVIVRKQHLTTDSKVPHGVFAISDDARPSADGRWASHFFLFFPPGQVPKEGMACNRIGYWQPSSSKSDMTWAPANDGSKARSRRTVGKLNMPTIDDLSKSPASRRVGRLKIPPCFETGTWDMVTATAYPISKCPNSFMPEQSGYICGVWEEPKDAPNPVRDPIDLVLTPLDDNTNTKNNEFSGYFSIKNKARPRENGTWNPRDFLFFPPSLDPDEDESTKIGRWKFPDTQGVVSWPPRRSVKSGRSRLDGSHHQLNDSNHSSVERLSLSPINGRISLTKRLEQRWSPSPARDVQKLKIPLKFSDSDSPSVRDTPGRKRDKMEKLGLSPSRAKDVHNLKVPMKFGEEDSANIQKTPEYKRRTVGKLDQIYSPSPMVSPTPSPRRTPGKNGRKLGKAERVWSPSPAKNVGKLEIPTRFNESDVRSSKHTPSRSGRKVGKLEQVWSPSPVKDARKLEVPMKFNGSDPLSVTETPKTSTGKVEKLGQIWSPSPGKNVGKLKIPTQFNATTTTESPIVQGSQESGGRRKVGKLKIPTFKF